MLILIVLYVIVPGLQIVFFVQNLLLWDPPELVNYVSGIVCYHWMLANVIVSVKLPVLQTHLPYDMRIRFHLVGTIGIGATLFYHAFYKIGIGKNIDLVAWSLLCLFSFIIVAGIVWIPLPVFGSIRKKMLPAIKGMFLGSYDIMKRFHIGLFVSLSVLMFWHVILANLFFMVPDYSAWIYALSFGIVISVYAYTKLRNRFLPKLEVTRLEETAGIVTLRFTGRHRLSYRPGQFAFIRFDRREFSGEEHPFSFLSIPGEEAASFGIRMSGDFTEKLKILETGDRARINAGFGAFMPREKDRKTGLCFIGSGIGSTPFISLLKQMHAEKDPTPVQFFLAVNTEREIPEYDELTRLVSGMPKWRMHVLLWEKDRTLYSYEYFRDNIERPVGLSYFVCCSGPVRKAVFSALYRLGVKKKNIHYEAFSFG